MMWVFSVLMPVLLARTRMHKLYPPHAQHAFISNSIMAGSRSKSRPWRGLYLTMQAVADHTNLPAPQPPSDVTGGAVFRGDSDTNAGALFSPDPTSEVLQALESVERKVHAAHAPAQQMLQTPANAALPPLATPSTFWPTGDSDSIMHLPSATLMRTNPLGPAGDSTSWGAAPMVGPPSAQTTLKRTSIHVLDSRKRARIASDDTGVHPTPTHTSLGSMAALGTQSDPQPSQIPMSQVRPSQYWARLPQDEQRRLTTYLPEDLAEKYMPSSSGNEGLLYEWQAQCLVMPGVLTGRNLVYTAPTGGGKTLVAEVLLMRRMLERLQRGCTSVAGMIVLPYNAVCREKADALERLFSQVPTMTHWDVRRCFGAQGRSTAVGTATIFVCTMERANSIANKWLQGGELHKLCCVVVDELHMVGDDERGYLLELLLTKLRYINDKQAGRVSQPGGTTGASTSTQPGCVGVEEEEDVQGLQSNAQLIGMSATLGNGEQVAQWLDAAYFASDYRPIELRQWAVRMQPAPKDDSDRRPVVVTMDKDGKESNTRHPEAWWSEDKDLLALTTWEVVRQQKSVLIFSNTRRDCNAVAQQLCSCLGGRIPLRSAPHPATTTNPDENPRQALATELANLGGTTAAELAAFAQHGIAFHHGDLSSEERLLVESGFKAGTLSVLVATTTLAAGINLPARRVILRHCWVERNHKKELLHPTVYRQMIGRAGRAGHDDRGEAVLMVTPGATTEQVLGLMQAPMPESRSALSEDRRGFWVALLEVAGFGLVQNVAELNHYVRCTLLVHTCATEQAVKTAVTQALQELAKKQCIHFNLDNMSVQLLNGGQACLASGLHPELVAGVQEDLSSALKGLVMCTDLHLLYLLVPPGEQLPIEWDIFDTWYLNVCSRQHTGEWHVFRQLFPDQTLLQHMLSQMNKFYMECQLEADFLKRRISIQSVKPEDLLMLFRTCVRLHAARALQLLVEENPVEKVVEVMLGKEGKGRQGERLKQIKDLQDRACQFAGKVAAICESLGGRFRMLGPMFTSYQSRLLQGVRQELLELTELDGVGPSTARLLHNQRCTSIAHVAELHPSKLAEWLRSVDTKDRAKDDSTVFDIRAKRIIKAAKELLLQRANEMQQRALEALQLAGQPDDTAPLVEGESAAGVAGDAQAQQETSVTIQHHESAGPSLTTPAMQRNAQSPMGAANAVEGPPHTMGSVVDSPALGSQPLDDEIVHVPGSDRADKTCLPMGAHPPNNIPPEWLQPGRPPLVAASDADVQRVVTWWAKQSMFGFAMELQPRAARTHAGTPKLPGPPAKAHHGSTHVSLDEHAQRIRGIALAWPIAEAPNAQPGLHVAYIPLRNPQDAQRWWPLLLGQLQRAATVKVTWNLKAQLSALLYADKASSLPACTIQPPCIDGRIEQWLLQPESRWVVDEDSGGASGSMCLPSLLRLTSKKTCSADFLAAECASGAVAPAEGTAQPPNSALAAFGAGARDCCRLAAHALLLHCCLEGAMQLHQQEGPLMHLEMPLVPVLCAMEHVGMLLDPEELCTRQLGLLDRGIQEMASRIRAFKEAACGAEQAAALNLDAPEELARLLFEDMALVPPPCAVSVNKRTGRKKYSTKGAVLDELAMQDKARNVVECIKLYRTLKKIKEQLHDVLLHKVQQQQHARMPLAEQLGGGGSGADGVVAETTKQAPFRLHTNLMQTSTGTGRLASDRPNLQTVPRVRALMLLLTQSQHSSPNNNIDNNTTINNNATTTISSPPRRQLRTVVANVRKAFIVPPGYIMMSADYKQLELRMAAHLAGDAHLQNSLREEDPFSALAASQQRIPVTAVSPEARNAAKAVAYGLLYGKGMLALARDMQCDVEEARRIHDELWAMMPRVQAWRQEVLQYCRVHKHVCTLAGRRRPLPHIDSGHAGVRGQAERQAINTVCQGSAADVVKRAMIALPARIQALGLEGHCRMIMQIHDELLFEIYEPALATVAKVIRDVLENTTVTTVPLPVKLQVGPNWGELEEYTAS